MIRNSSKDTVVADSFEKCISWWEQSRGLMFRDVSPLLFIFDKPKIVRLHSWFVREPLDLVFLDDGWTVVELVSEWPTRSTYCSREKALFLLELPAGSIAVSKTEIGDTFSIR